MPIRWKRAKLYVYQKIIIVFFVLLIPVYAINMSINYMGRSFVKDQILTSNLSVSSSFASQLDNTISFIRSQQLEFLNGSEVQKLVFLADSLDKFEEIMLVQAIRERLLTLQNASPFIVNSGLYVNAYGKTISTAGGVSAMPNREWQSIEQTMAASAHKSVYYSQDRILFLQAVNNSKAIAYLELSAGRFREALHQLVQGGGKAGVAIVDEAAAAPVVYDEADSALLTAMIEALPEDQNSSADGHLVFASADRTYLASAAPLHAYGWKLLTYVDEKELTGPLKKFNQWFYGLIVVSFIIILLFSFSVNRMIHQPLSKLLQSFRKMELDHLQSASPPKRDTEFNYIYRSFDSMVDKLNLSVRQNYEQKLALQQSELKQLQSQINPHFLYNGFYNIYRFCKSNDHDNAATLAQRLASYYHFITRSGSDEATLKVEYRNALDYCEIQRIRFSNRIELTFDDLPKHLEGIMVPRLILQPILENAFEHAFEHSSKGGKLRLQVEEQGDRLIFRMEDDGSQLLDEHIRQLEEKLKLPSGSQEKTGIQNVNARIKLKYGNEYGVFVSRSLWGGLCVEVALSNRGGESNVPLVDRG